MPTDRPEECALSVTLYDEVLIGVLDLDLDRSTGLLARLGGVVLLLSGTTRSASLSDLPELGVASTDLSLSSLLLLTGVLDLDLDRDLSDLTTLGDRRLLPLVGASTSGAISLP